jgi:D-alanyl-lipoteichoic acid acyltransferase DltB (MBOAT superfamily)
LDVVDSKVARYDLTAVGGTADAQPTPRLRTGHSAGAHPRAGNATTNLRQFVVLAAQFGAMVWVFRSFQLEERAFNVLMGVAFGGFLVHYWLPFAAKEPFWIVLSLVGSVLLVGALPTTILVAVGLAFFALFTTSLAYRTKVAAMLAAAALLMVGREIENLGIPAAVWPVLGALFMFRMIIYVYDLRHAKGPLSLQEYAAYFYPLPNFYFLLFPVVDFQTQRRTYYQRDIHEMAQQGLLWMVRGGVQLLLYRLVYFLKPSFSSDDVVSFNTLVVAMVGTYLLYLRVSGQFHIIVGMMHMFGYDLPETHRRYLLASSLTDFWRRINIYWKDFMVKIVYFPVFFRLRKSGEMRAQVVATSCVFVVTWLLHSYQWFWLRGELLLTWTDTLFWAILGALVIVNLLMEQRRKPAPPSSGWQAQAVHGLKVLGTLTFIVVLWSFWHSPTVEQWLDVMMWWRA